MILLTTLVNIHDLDLVAEVIVPFLYDFFKKKRKKIKEKGIGVSCPTTPVILIATSIGFLRACDSIQLLRTKLKRLFPGLASIAASLKSPNCMLFKELLHAQLKQLGLGIEEVNTSFTWCYFSSPDSDILTILATTRRYLY